VKFKELPGDMQVLLSDLTGRYDLDEKELTVSELPVDVFPPVPVESGFGNPDCRELRDYLEPMRQDSLPPIVLVGCWWVDGVHRIAAARIVRKKTVKVIDLAEIGVDLGSIFEGDRLGFVYRGGADDNDS